MDDEFRQFQRSEFDGTDAEYFEHLLADDDALALDHAAYEEILRAVADEIGADRVAIRLSPQNNIQGIAEVDEADVLATYGGLLRATADLGLAYVSIMHADPAGELRGVCPPRPQTGRTAPAG